MPAQRRSDRDTARPTVFLMKSYTVDRRRWVELNRGEEVLVEAFRRLPAQAAEELSALAQRLAALGSGTSIDWSGAWSDSDLHAFTADSLRRLDVDEQEDTP